MYFPLFLDLSEKEILVAGAGKIAQRRLRSLDGFAGHITIVAPEIPEDLGIRETPVSLIRRGFMDADLDGRDLVLAATNDPELNARIGALCRRMQIPVNVCSSAGLCDFQFPSIVEYHSSVIGINASGTNHHLVKETRQRVERLLADGREKSRYE